MKLRRAIFLLHLTAGCVAGTVILFLAATGFLLAWQKPAIAWAERGYNSPPPQDRMASLPVDRLIEIAATNEGTQPTFVIVKADLTAPVEVDFGRDQRLFLNRFTGVPLGPGATRTRAFFETVTALHRYFATPARDHAGARLVKGAFTLAFLFLIATGLFLWIPRNWNWGRLKASAVLRFDLSGRARNWNLHNVLGIWAAVPLAVIALTGGILAYSWMTALLYLATGSAGPANGKTAAVLSRKHHASVAPDSPTVSMQQILDNARRQAVGWQSLRIALPNAADRRLDVNVDFADGGRPDRQATLIFDRQTGEAVQQTSFSSLNLGRRLRAFTKYVHTGEAGGLAGETAAGLTALACCFLVWTGLAMALQRLRQWQLMPRRAATAAGAAEVPDEPVTGAPIRTLH
jgi:uncharacterized iron-regulated membrane protein